MIKAIFSLWFGAVLSAAIAFLVQVILTRNMSVSEYGLFSSAYVTVSLIAPVAGFGVAKLWLRQFGQQGWGAIQWLKPSLILMGWMSLIVMMALYLWIFVSSQGTHYSNILLLLSFFVLFSMLNELVVSKYQLEGRYKNIVIWQVSQNILKLFLVLVSIYFVGEFNAYYAAIVFFVLFVTFIIIGSGSVLSLWRGEIKLVGHADNKSECNGVRGSLVILRDSWPFGMAGIFYLVYFQSDILFIKYIVGEAEAGIYNVAFIVISAIYIFPSVVYQKFLMPKLHRWAENDGARFYLTYTKGLKYMFSMGILAMLTLWVSAPFFVGGIFGSDYTAVVGILNVLMLCIPLRFLATCIGSVLVTGEMMKKKVYFMGGVAAFNLCLNYFLVPIYSFYGAAISTVLSELALMVVYYIAVRVYVFPKHYTVA